MGGAFSKATATAATTTAVRTVPASAHKADSIAKAAIASFPPSPTVPQSGGPLQQPLPTDEREAHRGIVEMLNKTTINTQTTASSSSANSTDAPITPPAGVPLDDVIAALMLHGEDPQKHTAPKLAQRYGISDVGALSDALEHVRAYRIIADKDGRPRGLAIGEEEPTAEPDLFAVIKESADTARPVAELPPPR
jgi:hypothetical protein